MGEGSRDEVAPLLQLDNVSKRFPGVQALDSVSLTCYPGEVLALVGENGAGKSTLIKILAGAHQPDSGTITFGGDRIGAFAPAAARKLGISVIYQEFNLVPGMSVLQNMFLGQEVTTLGRLDVAGMARLARAQLDKIGAHVDLRAPIAALSVAQQQQVEIARSLLGRSRLIVMDEPSAVLAGEELERLLRTVQTLRSQGLAVLFVSHRLSEVFRVADRVAVLKDGQLVGVWPAEELNHDELVRQMIGRPVSSVFPKSRHTPKEAVLRVRNLSTSGKLQGLTFDVRQGEIVGIGGLVGSGRTTLVRALFGEIRHTGTVELAGRPRPRIRQAIRAGVSLVPEDRKEAGLVLGKSVRFNLSLPNLSSLASGGLLRRASEDELVGNLARQVSLPEDHLNRDVSLLSGGTQQKVVLGKWLARPPTVAILDEPTRGIDIGAKTEIYEHIRALADAGVAVLVVTSDLIELLGLSDRILVLRDGRLTGELSQAEATEEAVMRLATGAGAA